MIKRERKKYGLLPPKIAESDHVSLGHGLCGSGGTIYNKDTSQNALSACTHNDIFSNQIKAALKLSKPQVSQQHPSRICFITPDWRVTRDLNLFSLTMGVWVNSIVISNKCVRYQSFIKAKPTTNHKTQANAIIEQVHKINTCQLYVQII
jgi:hypothetical protein